MDFEVAFYQKDDGSCPAIDFILGLDVKMRAKVMRSIELLKHNGSDLREPYSKKLSDDLFELRIQQGNNAARMLYFFIVGKRIIITNGFIKKTQKTPQKELDLAIKYKNDYLNGK